MENQSLTTFFLFLAPKNQKLKKIIVVLPNFLSSKRTRLEDARRLSYPTKEPFSSLRGRSTPLHSNLIQGARKPAHGQNFRLKQQLMEVQ